MIRARVSVEDWVQNPLVMQGSHARVALLSLAFMGHLEINICLSETTNQREVF